jgi:hypothetical protein
MTYKELATKIAALTPEQQACTVRFLEPYDSFKIHAPRLELLDGEDGEEIADEDGETIRVGEPYLG